VCDRQRKPKLDYRTTDLIPEPVTGAPVQHVEQFARVTGEVAVRGERAAIQSAGVLRMANFRNGGAADGAPRREIELLTKTFDSVR